jgi:hypothetical protein
MAGEHGPGFAVAHRRRRSLLAALDQAKHRQMAEEGLMNAIRAPAQADVFSSCRARPGRAGRSG